MPDSRVLIVEGELLVAQDIQSRLGRLGYQIAGIASNGREAVSMALATMPDLILMDLDLGGDMDGVEVVLKIIESAFPPVIFCTACSNDTFMERAARLPSFGYLQKPFDNRALQISIRMVLSRHDAEQARATRTMYLDATLDSITDGIVVADTSGRVALINPAAEKIIGVDRHTAFGLRLDELVRTRAFGRGQVSVNLLDHDTFAIWQQFSGLRQWLIRPDERQVPVELSANCPRNDTSLTVVTLRDISSQLAYEENLRRDTFHAALFDDLTALPNRILFINRLNVVVSRQQNNPAPFAILLVGLDEFSAVNDSFGREVGDLVIKEVGNRIAGTLAGTRPTATVARFEDDIFAVLLDTLDSPDPAAASLLVSHQILAAVLEPLSVSETSLNITVSAGIAVGWVKPVSAEEMIRDAAARLARAQVGSKSHDDEMSVNVARFVTRQHKLQRAMLEGEFDVHYQPVLNLAEGMLVGLEAMLRWPDPMNDMVSSAEFVPVAEVAGLTLPLGEMVLQQVCGQIRQWQDMGFQDIYVAINLNERQFETDIAALVRAVLRDAGVKPTRLGLNITEEVAVNILLHGLLNNIARKVTRKVHMLEDLRQSGVSISMDSFGTGNASLSHIRRLPLTGLKIDQSLTGDITWNKDAVETVLAINALAHSLNLTVLAGGVVTVEQADVLQDCGCDYAHGFLYSRPLPASEMTEYLKNYA